MPTDLATLDDEEALGAPGAAVMLRLAGQLGRQLHEGFELGVGCPGLPVGDGARAVAVCGMGGSGIAGDILRCLFAARLALPIVVVKGYELPEFCGRDTVVLAASFSGETEETLAAYAEAVSRGCRVVAVSANGSLAALAEADGVPHVALPPDIPMPRAALGYLVGSALGVIDAMDLVPPVASEIEETAVLLDSVANRLRPGVGTDENEAKGLAAWVGDRVPVVWGSEGIAEAAALRWRSQLHENAKGPAWAGVFPELDHNEVEGWTGSAGAAFAAVALRHAGEHPRIGARVEATIEAVAAAGLEVRQVHAVGTRALESMFSLLMVGDFVSIYLGVLRGVDPLPVPVLTGLKERLRS